MPDELTARPGPGAGAVDHDDPRQIPAGALTVLEASGNTCATVRRLEAIGYKAEVMPSDIATGMAPLIESAQSAMRCGRQPIHNWARRLSAKGKAYNLSVSALACKMLMALWHALMGHPVPGCEAEMVHVRKVVQAASTSVILWKSLDFFPHFSLSPLP